MADIVDIDDFKQRRLAKAEADWLDYMTRAEEFQNAGKTKFAAEMLEKAKAARKIIDKLRGPMVKAPDPAPYLKTSYPNSGIAFTFAGADLGYPKVTPTPTK